MTMTNAEWCIKNGYKLRDIDASRKDDSNWEFEFKILASDHLYRKIGQLKTYNSMYPSEAVLEWLDMEHKEQILDDSEKRYLSTVIRPFRNKVKSITKVSDEDLGGSLGYHLVIRFFYEYFDMHWPSFLKDTMYKGMEVDKEYTVEELGL